MRHLLILITACMLSCMKQAAPPAGNDLQSLLSSGQPVLLENLVITHDLDFTTLLTPRLVGEDAYQVTAHSPITFRNCTFKGKVTGFRQDADNRVYISSFQQNLSFLDCIFEEEVNLRTIHVQGRADFTGSSFYQSASFEEATFQGDAYFTRSIFYGDAKFQNSLFQKKLYCVDAEFQKVGSFQQATFQADVHFTLSRFYGYADMALAVFHQHAFFNYAKFQAMANFNHTSLRGRFELMNAFVSEGSFRESIFWEKSRFQGVEIKQSIDMKNACFVSMPPETEDSARFLHLNSIREPVKTGPVIPSK